MQDNLDDLLRQRVAPEARSDLADRILRETAPKAKASKKFWNLPQLMWLRPAVALACFALCVVLVGVYFNGTVEQMTMASNAQDLDVIDDIAMYMVYDSLL